MIILGLILLLFVQIRAADFIGPERPGRKIVILGDTCDNQQVAELCRNADVLVHEATLEDDMKDDALKKGHSTAGCRFHEIH